MCQAITVLDLLAFGVGGVLAGVGLALLYGVGLARGWWF